MIRHDMLWWHVVPKNKKTFFQIVWPSLGHDWLSWLIILSLSKIGKSYLLTFGTLIAIITAYFSLFFVLKSINIQKTKQNIFFAYSFIVFSARRLAYRGSYGWQSIRCLGCKFAGVGSPGNLRFWKFNIKIATYEEK